MYLLPVSRFNEWWPKVSKLLNKAWDTTNIGDFYDLSDVEAQIKDERCYCFVSSDMKYAGVFNIRSTPKASILHFWLSGGEEPVGGWEKVDEFLNNISQVFGCSYIKLEGRVGWKKKVAPLGYEVDSLIMIKEV